MHVKTMNKSEMRDVDDIELDGGIYEDNEVDLDLNNDENRDTFGLHSMKTLGYTTITPSFIQGFQEQLVLPLVVIFFARFASNDEQVGMIVAFYGVGRVLMDLPAGGAISKLGTRTVMAFAAICECLGALLGGFAVNRGMVLTSRLFAGFGMSLFMLSRTAFVTSTVDDDHRGRIMSILGFIRRLMALFAPIVAGFIAHYTMSSNVFFLQIILCVVYGLWAFYYIPVGVGKNATLHRRGSTGSVDADSALGLGEYSSILEDGDAIIGGDGHEAAISHALITNDGQIHTNETFYSGAGEKRDWCGQCECVAKLFGPVIRQVRKYAITVGLYWKHLLLVGTYCQVMNTVRQSRVLLIPLQATGMGLSDLTVSVIVGIGWGMDALFAPVSGYMMDRHGRLFCGCLTGLVMAASFFILAGVSIMYPPMEGASLAAELEGTAPLSAGMSNSTTSGTDETLTAGSHTSTEAVAAILIASMAMGISNGASGGLILTLSSDIAQLHPRRRGEFLALFMVIVDTGFIFGPYVAGAIANAVGIAWSSAAVGVLSIASSLWMLLLIPETKGMGARYRQFLEDRANEADLMRDTPVGTEYDEPENTKTEESGPRSLQGGPNS